MKLIRTALLSALFMSSVHAYSVAEGEAFPLLDISKNATTTVSSKDFAGKVTVVNFWATWCEACKVELKEMQAEFGELLKNKDFQFLFVSLDKDPTTAENWVKENVKNADAFIAYLHQDPQFKVAETLNVDSFPMTFVIGKDGKIAKIQRGFKEGEKSTEAIAKLADGLLKS